MALSKALAVAENCSVCLSGFREPKVLPCCHSFCLHCLEEAHEKTKDKKSLTCPQCRTQHQMPPNGVKGFLNDYTLIPSKEDTHTPATCQQCEDNNNVVAYCNTCSHICNECLAAHKRCKTFRSHEIVSGDEESQSKLQPKKTYYCTVHPEEGLKVYCKSCQVLACIYCFMSAHNGHDIRNIDNESRMEAEKTINELADITDSKLREFENNWKYISSVEKDKAESSAPIKDEISKKVSILIAKIKQKQKKMLQEIDDACTKDLKELWAQKEYHETAITSMEGALSFARRGLACKEDTELLALCAQVTSRLKELSQLKWDRQETEKIEITAVKWTPATSDNVSVGKVGTHIAILNIQIEPIKIPSTFKPGVMVVFRVMVAFTSSPENVQPREHHNLKLSGSASCSGSRHAPGYYSYQKSVAEKVAVQIVKSQNEWTIYFNPPSTTSITLNLTASGQYGQQSVSTRRSFCLSVCMA